MNIFTKETPEFGYNEAWGAYIWNGKTMLSAYGRSEQEAVKKLEQRLEEIENEVQTRV